MFAIFDTIYPISDSLKDAIIKHTKIINVKKKTTLLSAGDKCDTIYFILSGASRVYYLNDEGIETTNWFLFENEFAISVYSFFTGLPGFEYIQTIEDCRLIALNGGTLDWIYENFIEFNFIGRKLTESYYIRNEDQASSLRNLNATERYQKLLKSSPQLINRVPLGYIASYLGISQETLSRIRKKS